MSRVPRDYPAEYRRRLALGRERGVSRQKARGHGGGEGRAVRARPRGRLARQAARERGSAVRRYGEVLRRAGRRDLGEGAKRPPYRGGLLDRAAWGGAWDVFFVFLVPVDPEDENGTPPPVVWVMNDGVLEPWGYQTVPLYVGAAPSNTEHARLGDVLADFDTFLERARQGTADPARAEFVDAWYNKRSGGERGRYYSRKRR